MLITFVTNVRQGREIGSGMRLKRGTSQVSATVLQGDPSIRGESTLGCYECPLDDILCPLSGSWTIRATNIKFP
jgi:hypothetical protein